MAKLYFKYGAMGSSKSAQALITQFNYEELGMTVWLIKPSVDDRDGANIIRSRIGLQREAGAVHHIWCLQAVTFPPSVLLSVAHNSYAFLLLSCHTILCFFL